MKVFFAGSFNPFTKGHADILKRLLKMADFAVVGVGVNIEKPESRETSGRNAEAIRRFVETEGLADRVEVVVYDGFTAEEARRHGADCMARGVRNATDFDYEYALASANRDAFGMETILLPSSPEFSFVSSTMIRDLERNGRGDLARKYKEC